MGTSNFLQRIQVLEETSAQACSVMRLQPVRPGFHDCSISPRRSNMNITPLSHSSFVTLCCSNICELVSFLKPSERRLLSIAIHTSSFKTCRGWQQVCMIHPSLPGVSYTPEGMFILLATKLEPKFLASFTRWGVLAPAAPQMA